MEVNNVKFIPKQYKNYYKNLLIEDLIADHPLECYYGKCSIIGKLIFDADSKLYFMESICITSLPAELQYPDGSFQLRLLTDLLKDVLPVGKTVEAIGEIVLWDREAPAHGLLNALPKTSYDLCLELQMKHTALEQELCLPHKESTGVIHENMHPRIASMLQEEKNNMFERYEVALRPIYLLPNKEAVNIITINLELKAVRNFYKETLRKLEKYMSTRVTGVAACNGSS